MIPAQSKKAKSTNKLIQSAVAVECNAKSLLKAKEDRVKRACKAFQGAGAPSVQNINSSIQLNLIKDSKVTAEDANLAEKVCYPDAGSLKGKSAQSKLVPTANNTAEIRDKLINVNEQSKLFVHRLSVDNSNFATTIGHDLFHRSAALIKLTHWECIHNRIKGIHVPC